ncbi:MAG: Gfo/Idh/MocA family oxidoreductase [Ruminococcaceae bacterium]|nr:Gfo/Idh/MocA family oxidoreductase [Oscillospiraceae bacterium]
MQEIKYSVIGTSWITNSFIEGAKTVEGLVLDGVYSRSEEKGKAFCEKVGAQRVFKSIEEVADSDTDFVYVASPNVCHYEQCKFLLENKKSVICEKPITTTSEEFSKLFFLAEENNVRYFEAIMYMHTDTRNALKQAVRGIGNISSAYFDYSQLSSKYEALLAGELPNIFNPKMKTGALNDLGIYCVYPAIDIFGEPQEVTALQNFIFTGADGAGSAILKYKDKIVTITYSKTAESRSASQILGDNGTITIDSVSQLRGITCYDKSGNKIDVLGSEEKTALMANEARSMYNFLTDFENNKGLYYECAAMSQKVLSCMEKMRTKNGEE